MFNFLISINGKSSFAVKSLGEVGSYFNYFQEEFEVNHFELDFHRIEVFKVDNISQQQAAQWLGTDDIIAGLSEDGEIKVFAKYEECGNCDFYFSFNCEDEKRIDVKRF